MRRPPSSSGTVGTIAPTAVAAIAVAALFYERTPLKRFFLRACTGGMSDAGGRNAFMLGLKQGALCVGCCWLLMTALFALGATNLLLTITVTALVVGQRVLASVSRNGECDKIEARMHA